MRFSGNNLGSILGVRMENGRAFTSERKNLIVRRLKDELILYDRKTNRAYCLNRVAGEVWGLCDGKTTLSEIVEHFQKIGEPEIDRNVIYLSLRKLERAGLLKNDWPDVERITLSSRRALIKKLGIAATLSLPIVTSIA